jgi:aconitate hydratase
MPLVFADPADYDDFSIGDKLVIENAVGQMKSGTVIVKNSVTGKEYKAVTNFSDLELEMILRGGKINMIKGE